MKVFKQGNLALRKTIFISARSLFVAGFLFLSAKALSQTAPGLAIAAAGTNGFSVTFTNALPGFNYEVWWIPVLGDPDYLWTMTPPGSPGQTNFLVANSGYPAVFFRGALDTNNPPLWENANPNNPGTNLLKITIASPANGAVLQ
jgi:hypothetical protein